jgi:hypothetical protein
MEGRNPLEFNLDNSCFNATTDEARGFADMTDDRHDYMFQYAQTVERLSIKNATITIENERDAPRPISQEILIKMVRNHPALQWLRSDLTAANIAMLQRERPEMTFVSE